jgi:hypothetical protein
LGIQKDAEELLIYCYKEKIAGKGVPSTQDELIEVTKWEPHRIFSALEYLIRKGLILGELHGAIGRHGTVFVLINDISPDGIDIIENPKKFEQHFEHTVDIGFYKFSWGAKEKK